MALRKVLLLTYHFPPSGAVAVYRMLGLVRYLPQFGWQPVVVAPPRVPWEPIDASLLDQVPVQTPVARVPFVDGIAGRVIGRIAPEAHWIVKARAACDQMIAEHRPDAVITSSPPGIVHMLGRWVQKRHGLYWVACFRDPWITNRLDTSGLAARIDRRLERLVMRHADQIVANTPLNREGWCKEYPEHAAKMHVITNGFDPEKFTSIDVPPPGDRLMILHAGELYSGRDPRPFLDAFAQLQAEQVPVDCTFLGRTTDSMYSLAAEITRRGLDSTVHRPGQVPYVESLQKMMSADILVLFQNPGYRFGIQAKLFEYLGTGRPILAISELDSDIAWVLRESKVLHRVAAPTDVAGIRQAILELVAEARAGHDNGSDKSAALQFTRERMAQRFAECLDRSPPTRQ